MPGLDRVPAMFTEEWDRFRRGAANLNPQQLATERFIQERAALPASQRNQINIPGWDDFIKLGPETPASREEWQAHFAATRAGQRSPLDPALAASIERRAARRESMRRSITGDELTGWGQMLTALDNVQDFASTVATFGRLGLWLAPRLVARAVPGVNVIVGVSDVLNTLGLLGTVAVPLYALLCNGPSAALAAGVPAFLFKRVLCAETWKMHNLNPWSRRAEARHLPTRFISAELDTSVSLARARELRARRLGRLPGFSNLLEVGQTTQQLWGYGLSFGWMVGIMNETSTAAVAQARGAEVSVSFRNLTASWTKVFNQPLSERPFVEIDALHRASHVLLGAPLLLRHPERMPDEDVMLTLAAYVGALDLIVAQLAPYDAWRDVLGQSWGRFFEPPGQLSDFTRAALQLEDASSVPRAWALPGAPGTVTGADMFWSLQADVTAALERWILDRRNVPAGAFVGTIINMTTEVLFTLMTGERDALRWHLSTDARLLSSLAESGFVWSAASDEAATWKWWQAARALEEREELARTDPARWQQLADAHGVKLLRLLPADAPMPPEWMAAPPSTPSSTPGV